MDKKILKLENITKTFPGTLALDKVNFDLETGEVHALTGENGAGKSTLIKIISGIYQPDSGSIYLNGNLVNLKNTLFAQKHGIASIYQEPTIFPDLSVAENIYMGHQECSPITKRLNWKKMYYNAEQLLESLGLDLDPRTKVRNLSAAEQQLAEIVKALSLNSQILIMDEPTSALTLNEVTSLFKIIKHLKSLGKSIIFISHRIEEIFEIADRVTVLRDGHYISTNNISTVTVDELIKMMIGRTLNELFPKKFAKRGEPILKVEAFSKERQFHDITFKLHKGEILGFYGLIGAGRSELARAIFGLESPDSGKIFVNGEQVHVRNPRMTMKHGVAYLPEDRQHQGLILQMNITNNITLPILDQFIKMGLVDTGKEAGVAKKYADMLDVRASGLWKKVMQLSGGNQQKVVLAKWLATNPQILILDEPTRGIDVGAKASVHKFMSELVSQGIGIIMISSELPEILGMSDRIIVMCEGRITGEFTREEASQEKIISAAVGISSNKKNQME